LHGFVLFWRREVRSGGLKREAWSRKGYPHPGVIFHKSVELIENKGVDCSGDDKEFVTVW
jgi:hypothetical protein